MNHIQLSINNPCSEKFKNFSPTQSGGLCQSCQMEVIDFTKMTQTEILLYLKNRQGKTCGRLTSTQLEPFREPLLGKRTWRSRLIGAGILSFSLFTAYPFSKAQAQAPKPYAVSVINQTGNNQTHNVNSEKIRSVYAVSGIVVDEEDKPLNGASVWVKGTSTGVYTDPEGKFEFSNLQAGDTLQFAYLGFKKEDYVLPEEIPQTLPLFLKIQLEAEPYEWLGEVAVDHVYTTKRSFWQKIASIFK